MKKWLIFTMILLIVAILLMIANLMIPLSAEARKLQYHDVYAYKICEGFDLDAIHERILETGLQDVAIGINLYNIVEKTHIVKEGINALQEEVDWARDNLDGRIFVIQYNDTTRVGYDKDGQYRYYRPWEYRIEAMEEIRRMGVDYWLVDFGDMHYPSYKDLTTFLIAEKAVITNGFPFWARIRQFGVYDGDAVVDRLEYDLLADLGVFVWSDLYINRDTSEAYLRSPCGWDYQYLVTLCWLSPSKLIQSEEDMQAVRDLLQEKRFKGYNILETYDFEGMMPEWAEK